MFPSYEKCNLCARRCGVNRRAWKRGFCASPCDAVIARAALHMWEEPIISGARGSGAVFFCGCSLRCNFCQNAAISRGGAGISVKSERLAEIMLELEASGAHNVNLVTPTHFVPSIIPAIERARLSGLRIPIVYNTSSYDTVETLCALDGLVDIYIPDLKYATAKTAREYSAAEDYPTVARLAIAEMVRQQPKPIIKDGIMVAGVIARILLLPAHVAEAKLSVKHLYSAYGDSVYISLMNQYTPMPDMKPPLDRRVTRAEYYDLVSYAERIGVKNGFTQEYGTAEESFIPAFDNTGV